MSRVPEIVFFNSRKDALSKARALIAELLPDARREAASIFVRLLSGMRSNRLRIPGPARDKIVTMREYGRIGHTFVSVDEHADGSDMLDIGNKRPRRGRHVHELTLRDHQLHVSIETHGRMVGVQSTRSGVPRAVLELLSVAQDAILAATARHMDGPEDFRHAVGVRLEAAGHPAPTVRMSTMGGGTPLVVPAVDVQWPTPITPARFGIIDRDIDVWALNDQVDSGLPSSWELDVTTYGGMVRVELRPVVTILPRPVDPVAALRGEAAFAAAA